MLIPLTKKHIYTITGAIERVDRLIVGLVSYELQTKHRDDFGIVACGDHKTRCSDEKHVDDPVPFALFGKGTCALDTAEFGEPNCSLFDPVPSLEFLERALGH